jgi:antitoxin component YwqK of YwqJK toxin-antitoxin module
MSYCKGEIEGISEIYKDDGELLQTIEYMHGSKHGESKRYWSDNQIAAIEIYDKDRLISGKYFDRNDEQVSQIVDGKGTRAVFGKESVCELQQFMDGRQEGSIEKFSPDGKLVSRHKTKEGLKHGEEVFFYDQGKFAKELRPKLSINWYKGNIQGLVKTWYPEGQQESQREMTSNNKNGMLTGWYKNGALMLIEEYDQDVLVKGEYYKNGSKLPISEVNDGEGLVTLFDADGNFIRKINYRNGKPFEL